MAKRTPPLYASGTWKIRAPFAVESSAVYTCQAVRAFADLVALGIDPYERYYRPAGISLADYETDRENLPNIVTLMSDTEPTVYVPDTYIETYPALDTVPYRHLVLSVSLGPVPDTLVLDDLLAKVRETVINAIGIDDPTVRIHQAGAIVRGVSQMDHTVLENNRKAKLQNNTTDRAKVLTLQTQNTELQERVQFLEQLAIDNGLLS